VSGSVGSSSSANKSCAAASPFWIRLWVSLSCLRGFASMPAAVKKATNCPGVNCCICEGKKAKQIRIANALVTSSWRVAVLAAFVTTSFRACFLL